MPTKPYSAACDQNRDVILSVIQPLLQNAKAVLEIGSGSGQHAVYFAKNMPHLVWHTSDRLENHAGIQMWLDEANLSNVEKPLALNVRLDRWINKQFDAVFSANTVHIMHWQDVEALFVGLDKVLHSGALFILYGPFNYNGQYSSASNARFDQWLKQRDPDSGIRDFDALDRLAKQVGLILQRDDEMPVNNRILCWQKE